MKKIIIYDTLPDFAEEILQYTEIAELDEIKILSVVQSYPDYTKALNEYESEVDAVLFNTNTLDYTDKESDIAPKVFFYSTSNNDDKIPDFGEDLGVYSFGEAELLIENLIHKDFKRKNKVKNNKLQVENKKEEIKNNEKENKSNKNESDKNEDTNFKVKSQKEKNEDDFKRKPKENEHVISEQEWKQYQAYLKSRNSNAAKELKETNKEKQERDAEDDFKKNTSVKEKNTEVVSIFSAKGGTGKTTIAVQIASRLSRIPRGRGFLSVCLIDFDYEFGDVASVLALPEYEGEPLTSLINKINKGSTLSKDEIKEYCLQPEGIPTDTLFVIPAPATHIASLRLKIGTESVMKLIEEIKKTKEFDVIVCDTGNNLNAATLGILGASDSVYVVYTPDYTTIKCNDSALNSLVALDSENDNKSFYKGKFKAILNRETTLSGLEGTDIQKALNVPVSAIIKADDRVVYFNNDNFPIVFDDDSSFNSEIMPVIKDISGEDFELPEVAPKKKKGFFSFFKKKG